MMQRKFVFGWLAVIVGVFGSIVFVLYQIDKTFDLCEDVVMQEKQSPDLRLKAIVYSRECGIFTTGFTTQVTIVKKGDSLPKEIGNVYIERSEDAQPKVSVQWNGNQGLVVKDDPKITGRLYSEEEKKVTVGLGWFRSTKIGVRYVNAAEPESTTKN